MTCPICQSDMRSRNLLSHYSLKPYRVCPDCQGRYTADARTKKRNRVIAVLGLLTIALSIAGLNYGFPWGVASFLAGTVLLVYVGYGLSKLKYVEYRD